MLRVAVNCLESLPDSLADAPRLAWFSLAGNPAICCPPPQPKHAIADIEMGDVVIGRCLGEGASGEVFEVTYEGQVRFKALSGKLASWQAGKMASSCFRAAWVRQQSQWLATSARARVQAHALKQFRAADEASPDGCHEDEVAIQLLVDHPSLTLVRARVREPEALVLRIEPGQPMALKPNFESLLRCRWPADATFTPQCAAAVCRANRLLCGVALQHKTSCCEFRAAGPNAKLPLCCAGRRCEC